MTLVAFTICSNNYFHFAKVLAKSWLQYHPESRFVILLVDVFSDSVKYDFDDRVDVWPLDRLQLNNLDKLVSQYNIIELNTAVKADAFIQIFQHYKAEKVLYLDPDIRVFSPFVEVDELLDTYNIIVTPHYFTPIDDGHPTSDVHMLGSGLFNLGFIGLSSFEKVKGFLEWWRARLYKYAYFDLPNNMFYDQSWVNYITVFFDNYFILKHPGYNMANWNFHERRISKDDSGNYVVNEKYPLRFFHYSGYKLKHPDLFAFYHTRFSFETRPDVVPLYLDYKSELLNNKGDEFSKIPCVYHERHKLVRAEQELKEWKETPLKIRLARKAANLARKFIFSGK